MIGSRIMLATAAAASLALVSCGETADTDANATGDDRAMTTPAEETGSAPAVDDSKRTFDASRAQSAASDVDSLPEGDQCGASKVASFVSQNATADVRAKVAAEVGHNRIRWVGPDTAVTMDHSPERLNVLLDENGVITGARCG